MALVMRRVAKRDQTAEGAGERKTIRTARSAGLALPEVELAESPNDPLVSFDTQPAWFYGESGIGKSTLASMFPDNHFFCFEPGARYIKAKQKPVNNWLENCAYIDAFLASKLKFAIFDGMEDAYEMCFKFMCEEVLKISHPQDEKDYGKSWGAIYGEFVGQFNKVIRAGRGCIFISHAGEKLFKPQFGEEYELIRPTLASKPLERMLAKVDFMGYIWRDPRTQQNMMRIRPDGTIMAKTRPTELFLWKGTKEPIFDIPLGRSAAESFKAYHAAYHNQLAKPAEPAKKALPKLVLPRK